jgi:hypothetical protein
MSKCYSEDATVLNRGGGGLHTKRDLREAIPHRGRYTPYGWWHPTTGAGRDGTSRPMSRKSARTRSSTIATCRERSPSTSGTDCARDSAGSNRRRRRAPVPRRTRGIATATRRLRSHLAYPRRTHAVWDSTPRQLYFSACGREITVSLLTSSHSRMLHFGGSRFQLWIDTYVRDTQRRFVGVDSVMLA